MKKSVEELVQSGKLTRMQLLELIKKESSQVSIQDIMRATSFLTEDAKYMPAGYREDYIQHFSKAFFGRIADLKKDEGHYQGGVDAIRLQAFLDVLERQRSEAKSEDELCFLKIARVIAIYTTFIREEPVHPVGTKFPGGFTLRYEGGKYLCPVKDHQLKNPSALCRFCVSVQDKSVE
ncbi:MAG TPA: DUF2115 domain-containing protein [Methanobacteriaceae archaeon]|nr:DUF2115 domain-containing protein [Euryarchaeota archaeon]HNR25918.1 DUF2115 domain-containing protein [Methanobacteriaceae archaeon]